MHLLRKKNLINSVLKDETESLDQFIDFKGFKMFLQEGGEGKDTLLIHGFPDHSQNLKRLFDGLVPHQHMIAYDRLGSGRSDKPDQVYNLSQSVENLALLQNELSLDPMVLVGHSIGGTLSMLFAAKYPERVKAMVLINPAFKNFKIQTGMNYLGAWFLRWTLLGEFMLLFQNRFSTQQCLRMAFYNKNRMTKAMVDNYHFPFHTEGAKKSYLREMRSIYHMSDHLFLKEIDQVRNHRIPIFLVWTEKDWSMPIEDGQTFAKRLGAKLHTIPECGHSPYLELDDARLQKDLIQPIQGFLDQV